VTVRFGHRIPQKLPFNERANCGHETIERGSVSGDGSV
jgi:hypothetical protein